MVEWCGQARFAWNIALEQRELIRGLPLPKLSGIDQKRFVTEARKDIDWLKQGPSVVQQQAVLDLHQAFVNWWKNPGHFGRPTRRVKGKCTEGFCIRDVSVRRVDGRMAEVRVPKLGYVKFRLHRPLPAKFGMGRVTLDRQGRWHVSFSAIPAQIDGPADGTIIGIDRGITIDFQSSDGRRWDVAGLSAGEKQRLVRLQRKLARQQKGSKRRACTKQQIAKLKGREAARRKDLIEKATTEIARTVDIVKIEDLRVKNMMASASGTIDNPGSNVAQKRGLNRSIAETGWTMFARRLEDKIGDRLVRVPAAFTSQRCFACKEVDQDSRESQAEFRCRSCGHTANADVNAALNIAAGSAVTGRGGTGKLRPPDETSIVPAA